MIQTKRIHLREIQLPDLPFIHTLLSIPETDRFNAFGIPDTPQTTEKIVADWVSEQAVQPRTSYIYCIELLETNQFVGLIALILGKPKYKIGEVWFKIHVDHWRKGYTTEALLELLRFGFQDLALHRIEAGCTVENIASSKVLEKVGMMQEGIKRKLLPKEDEWKDTYIYAILEDDFNKMIPYEI